MEESNGENPTDETQQSVILGLPDDIALVCLARVPRKYHRALRCVSRKWRDLVVSEEWCSHRRKHKLDETWIYALCRDKSEKLRCYVLEPKRPMRCWVPIEGIPSPSLKRTGICFEVLGNKIYLFGGCRWSEDVSDEVFFYDASANTWSQGTPMSTPRCFGSSEVLDNKLYALGGYGLTSSDRPSWDTFDPHKRTWTFCSDPIMIDQIEDSFVMDGKIYIRCRNFPQNTHTSTFVYEPSSETWQHGDADMASGWLGPAVVVAGALYVLDESSGTKLMTWREDAREWVPVGRLSPLLTRPPCQLVAVGTIIYVIGKGLSTVMIDVGKPRNVDGVMMSSSISNLDSISDVISCKCLAI